LASQVRRSQGRRTKDSLSECEDEDGASGAGGRRDSVIISVPVLLAAVALVMALATRRALPRPVCDG
jgi:hypothetical protein